MPTSSGMLQSMNVNNLMLLSLFNKKNSSSSMPASSGMVLSTKVTVETITTDMEKNAHTCEQKQKCILSKNVQIFYKFYG